MARSTDARHPESDRPTRAAPAAGTEVGRPVGYSGTPLARKLGIRPGHVLWTWHAPDGYDDWIAPLPPDVVRVRQPSERVDLAHVFVVERTDLVRQLRSLRTQLRDDVGLWISWPKQAAQVPTTVTGDIIRSDCLPLGWVDVKVCAVTEVWSGLKLVVRKELRRAAE